MNTEIILSDAEKAAIELIPLKPVYADQLDTLNWSDYINHLRMAFKDGAQWQAHQPIKSAPNEWTNEDVECMADTLYLFSIGEKGFADDSKQNWTLDFVKKRASEILNKHYYKDDEPKNPVSL